MGIWRGCMHARSNAMPSSAWAPASWPVPMWRGGGMVAAGALVTPGKRVPKGELWAGRPAQKMRLLTPEEQKRIPWTAQHYVNLAKHYLPK